MHRKEAGRKLSHGTRLVGPPPTEVVRAYCVRSPLHVAWRRACAPGSPSGAGRKHLKATTTDWWPQARRPQFDAQNLGVAYDAAIEDAPQVTAACLWHTYLAFLVRQGIRFAGLTRLVGPLSADLIGAYRALAPTGARIGMAEIELLHPTLRGASD
jgi:hypothetical protein